MKTHSQKCASFGRSILECDCDGYHTFDELYEHRVTLWITLCKTLYLFEHVDLWRSEKHSDGELAFGGKWFVLGIGKENGKQITYHIPIERWSECEFAEILESWND